MRKLLALFFVCSFAISAQESQQLETIEIDSFDYRSMLQMSSMVLNKVFGERLQQMAEQEADIKMVPANDEEKMAMVVSFGFFLMAIARMQQEAACLNEPDQAFEMVQNVWEQGISVFSIMPEELQAASVRLALDWIEEHAKDSWQPTDEIDLYRPFAELPALRAEAVKEYYKLLGSVLE